ncbi:MAG: peptidylprolyl isomerase [Kangiellaceae bacterium]|nr:peptidylprolyl isomerase [Kangiellaceae bacterium]
MKNILSSVIGILLFAVIHGANAEEQLLDRVIAIVDENVVLESELVRRTNAIITQIRAREQAVPSKKILRKQVLERLIIESLQIQTAKRVGVRIDDQELSATIDKVAEGSKISADQLKEKVEQDGTAWAIFREDIRNEVMIDRVQRGMVQRRIQVSDKEIDNIVNQMDKEGETRTQYHLGHILISLSESATPEELSVKREEAKKIIDALRNGSNFEEFAIAFSSGQNSLEGGDMGWRSLNQLPTLFSGTVKNMAVNDVSEPLRSGSGLHILYLKDKKGGFAAQVVVQTKVRHILVSPDAITSDEQARDKVALARDRILNGDDFTTVAVEVSDDKSNAAQGGDMGWIDPGTFVKEFSEVMDKLELNVLSEPVKTQFGWHIMEVTGRRDQDQTENRKRDRAYRILSSRKYEEELQTWISELKDRAHIKYIDGNKS